MKPERKAFYLHRCAFKLILLLILSSLSTVSISQKIQNDLKAETSQRKKNVLFILCDDLRRDMLSYTGGHTQTPSVDALEKVSTDFTMACTTTGLCSPSRAALLTGRLGHRTGLDDNCQIWHSRLLELDQKQTTLIEWAREKGYFVGFFGKWHLGSLGVTKRGAHRFSEGQQMENKTGIRPKPDYAGVLRYYQEKDVKEKPQYYALSKGTYENSEPKTEANSAIEFLKEANQSSLPFFLTVSFHTPHPPYRVPKPYDTMYDFKKMILPSSLNDPFLNKPSFQKDAWWPWHNVEHMTKEDWQKTMAYASGSVSMLDRAIGEVLEALKNSGNWDNTLIIFSSDQGSMLGDHGLYDKMAYSYDELMRIPLLVKVPGEAPKKVNRLVSLIDINQTLVDWMGLKPTQTNLDSRSLLPLIKNGEKGWSTPDEAFYVYEWYNGAWFGVRTIRTAAYKYCFNPTGGIDELYDLKKDPMEITNQILNTNYVKIKNELQERLLNHLKKIDDPIYKTMEQLLYHNTNPFRAQSVE